MDVIFEKEAQEKLLIGVNKVFRVVAKTLGPKGANVIINTVSKPIITNDGVTIAEHIELEDEVENIGASLIKEIAIKTNELVGDGTTTSIILGSSILTEGMKLVEEGINPISIKQSINEFSYKVLDFIKKESIKEVDLDTVYNIAKISSGNAQVASLISEAFEKVGKDGTILITDSKKSKTTLNIIEGMSLESGYVHEEMISDNKSEEILENVDVIVTNEYISTLEDLEIKSLTLIICDDYDDAILEEVKNFSHQLFIIKAPLYGEKRKEILKDISYFTNGLAKKVILKKESTIIISDDPNVQERIKYLETKINEETSNYEKEILEKRLANLKGKLALIEVGGTTELEMIELKMHIEDALNASKSVYQNGYLPGGGLSYLNASKCLENINEVGANILMKSLKKPLYYILTNAGYDYDEIISKVHDNYGYDALNGKYTDLIKDGIIDSTEVVLKTIENSVSIANLLITTSAIVMGGKESKIDLDNVI